MLGAVIPDLRWTIKDIQTIGDQIIVRGEATGTPTASFRSETHRQKLQDDGA